ncbi:MAG: PQQ-binding-like beta-propeller repeat protein [Lacipirellulaceae bacterium]
MKIPLVVLALLITASIASPSRAEQWTQFRGPDFGRTTATDVVESWDTDAIAWKSPIEGRGASSPVVFDGRVYLTAFTGYAVDTKSPGDPTQLVRHLLCFDLKTGDPLWQRSIADDTEKDTFTNWGTAKAGYASSTAAVDESGVYVLFGATGVVAYSHDGEKRWTTFVGDDVHPYPGGSSPVLYKNLVIVNASYQCGDLIALQKSDGSEAWRQEDLKEAWNTPVVYQSLSGEEELAVSAMGEIRAVDPQTGELRWTCKGIDQYICPSLIVEKGILYAIGGKQGKAMAVRSGGSGDVTETHRLWETNKGANVSSPVFHDGYLYWAKDKGGILYCLDAETGELEYEKRTRPSPKEVYATPLLTDGKLYYVSRENGIFVVAATPEFKLLAHTELDDDSLFAASPVPLPGGSVLLRSDQFLYRLDPK